MPIERATFQVRRVGLRKVRQMPITQYVHKQCARHARAEWPELS
jgi:hypothetical protein